MEKVIHYCWFGGGDLTQLSMKCIDSWKKYLPEYRIHEWNENNFSIEGSIPFVKESYKNKNYAVVSDYVRLWAVYNFGGIYLDLDVELISSLEGLNLNFFAIERGFNSINTGLGFGQEEAGSCILKKNMEIYNSLDYKKEQMIFAPSVTTDMFKEMGVVVDNPRKNYQIGDTTIYAPEYFSPIDYCTKEKTFTLNTKSIHHYAESWK